MTKKEKPAVAKKAVAGEDIGRPGKKFKEVERKAKASGAKDPVTCSSQEVKIPLFLGL